jgi:hypothetical protein
MVRAFGQLRFDVNGLLGNLVDGVLGITQSHDLPQKCTPDAILPEVFLFPAFVTFRLVLQLLFKFRDTGLKTPCQGKGITVCGAPILTQRFSIGCEGIA